ncbi:hypothetical protein OlV7_201 [Ostreococcus lucimarinus virus 7]|jgi:hypothetical protein|uniref:hypothetical protein n=1 Tax=Ostreococcus lucimarinus virus 7 TaxID=1663209 RepID=UPI0006CF5587|nr:hypothetical protein AP054_gp207 [Ostreococcus lucimarinus virus 7]ALI95833.1 hypothetical protein OlV7_201 [Ostreococcus lucimarinus virus 7]QBP06892.1 hypothetical protein OlV7_gene198 [Ostreococcus lucimarinus virus 7]
MHVTVIGKLNMDRHHLLSLLDKIQEKYEIQDGEYKEFAEAIGGKKKLLEVKAGDIVKISYDQVESEIDFCDDEFYPKVNVTGKCSRIWKVIDNETAYHGCGGVIPYKYLNRFDIHLGAMNKIVKDHSEGNFTIMTLNSSNNRKYCFRVFEIEVI